MFPNLAEYVEHVVVGFSDAANHTKHVVTLWLFSLCWIGAFLFWPLKVYDIDSLRRVFDSVSKLILYVIYTDFICISIEITIEEILLQKFLW